MIGTGTVMTEGYDGTLNEPVGAQLEQPWDTSFMG